MSVPKSPKLSPYPTKVTSGKTYFWCACGQSHKQPFCDGSHKDTDFQPIKYTASKDGRIFFCGCKQTATTPLCDGSHSSIEAPTDK